MEKYTDIIINFCMVVITCCMFYIGYTATQKVKEIDKRLEQIEQKLKE